jgi:alpha-L-fucosidase
MDTYIDQIAVPQVREILSNYGPIAILWWDTPENMNEQRAARLFPLTKLQPGIITNDRLGGGFGGDLSTPEQFIPATGIPGKDWEACMTMNDTWGFKSYDNNWKSSMELIRGLAEAASKGGNFLLNVGPTQEGLIPQPSVERLESIGHWMAKYGESIYGTSAGPFSYLKWGRATRNGQTLYLHVFSWPSTGLLRVPLTNHVKKAWLLADAGTRLVARRTASHIEIQLPAEAPDPIDSVIALEIEGQPSPLPVPSLGKPGNASSSYGPGFTADLAFDGQPETCWRAGKGQKSAWLEVTFDKPYRVGAVNLVEGWEVESYIRRFRLQCKDRGQWKTIFEGTRIGRSLTKTFDAVTARTFRLDILEATDAPRIEEMQLFFDE